MFVNHNVQLYNCNIQPGNDEGMFRKMVLNEEIDLEVTTTGKRRDPHSKYILLAYTTFTLRSQSLNYFLSANYQNSAARIRLLLHYIYHYLNLCCSQSDVLNQAD